MVATKPWTMQLARAARRLMAAALRSSPVAFGTAFGTGYGTGFATAAGVMFLDDDVRRLELIERLERHVDLLEAAARAAASRRSTWRSSLSMSSRRRTSSSRNMTPAAVAKPVP